MTTEIVYVVQQYAEQTLRAASGRQAGRLTGKFHVPFHMLAKSLYPNLELIHISI